MLSTEVHHDSEFMSGYFHRKKTPSPLFHKKDGSLGPILLSQLSYHLVGLRFTSRGFLFLLPQLSRMSDKTRLFSLHDQ